ncbi:MAG: phosphate acetyltransferase [Clostridia bacterium]|nr:phosphate acetyltransferase [Clostridia bacterium]
MKFEKDIENLAKQLKKTVVFPEASVSDYIVEAAKYLTKHKLANVIILGDESSLVLRYKNLKNITIINPKTSDIADELAKIYFEKRKHKGITLEDAYTEILDPICFGALLVFGGIADCMVAGVETPTKKVIKRCLEVLKASQSNFVSSCMVISGKNSTMKREKVLFLSDCALNISPDKNQIKNIALQTALTAKCLNVEPKIALLSYSTNGSAAGESAEKMKAVAADLKQDLDLLVEGEMQLDAAVCPRILKKKFRGSRIKNQANVLIFPDLQSGNIAYKAIEYFGHLNAYGPILQGLSKPVADLSRGASVKEIIQTTLITCVLCE